MKWAAVSLLLITVIIFPIKASVSLYYEKGRGNIYFGVYLYFLRVASGSFVIGKKGITFKVFGKEKTVGFADIYKNRSKISFPKLISVLEVSVAVKCPEGENPAERLFFLSCLSNALKATKPLIKEKYPYFKSENGFIIDGKEERLKVNVFASVGFNLLAVIITILSKLYEVVFNGKSKSKQNRRTC